MSRFCVLLEQRYAGMFQKFQKCGLRRKITVFR